MWPSIVVDWALKPTPAYASSRPGKLPAQFLRSPKTEVSNWPSQWFVQCACDSWPLSAYPPPPPPHPTPSGLSLSLSSQSHALSAPCGSHRSGCLGVARARARVCVCVCAVCQCSLLCSVAVAVAAASILCVSVYTKKTGFSTSQLGLLLFFGLDAQCGIGGRRKN